MTTMDNIKVLLEEHGVYGSANDFLVLLWGISQFFDDVFDGDPVQDFDRVLYGALLGLPCNEFYLENRAALAPAVHVAIEKWQLANSLERAGLGTPHTFMWRAGYWDIVATVCSLTGNRNVQAVLGLYGENYEEYLKEVNHA